MTYWLMFIGEGRSGHTIISACLGVHPHIRLSDEQKYINKWVNEDWSRDHILEHLHQSGSGQQRP